MADNLIVGFTRDELTEMVRQILAEMPSVATASTDGLMSASDKSKLDSADDTYALKSKYGDTTINVGRKADTDVGLRSTAEGRDTTASGHYSHAEGDHTTASGGQSHAEGDITVASGDISHAEGRQSRATGVASHAEGWMGHAYGHSSHAEGMDTTASGDSAHAEGTGTTASGHHSHAGGYYTNALHNYEVAYGKYNQSNDDTLYSIGDGTYDARHNAFEITTTGGKLHDKDIATTDLIPTSLPANGGTADTARQVIGSSSKIRLFENNEGGNLELVAPDGVHRVEMDLYNNECFRMYFNDGTHLHFPMVFDFNTGKFDINGNADTLDNKHASDFANSYNYELMRYLNGQSGDIRALVYQLPSGGYIFDAGLAELSGVTFPIPHGILSWAACKYSANEFIYGILIARPMLSVSNTYICSIYNTHSYTEWERIYTDHDKP